MRSWKHGVVRKSVASSVPVQVRLAAPMVYKFSNFKTYEKRRKQQFFLQEMLRRPRVAGSSPAPLINKWVAQLVEQRLKKSVLFFLQSVSSGS